jgi:hypothetical protein
LPNLIGQSALVTVAGVDGENTNGGPGVNGLSTTGDGVVGTGRRGVVGISDTFQGVYGKSKDNAGVVGESDNLHGVFGTCHNPHGAGVFGTNDQVGGFGLQGINESGDGVVGTGRRGVVGTSDTFQGVFGKSTDNAGVVGESDKLHGVFGTCHNPNGAGVFGTNDQAGGFGVIGVSDSGIGVSGKGGRLAGSFEGDVEVTGNLHVTGNITTDGDVILSNADCAEEFDLAGNVPVEPGMVMVLNEDGEVTQSQEAYDKRVAGVVSGAGSYRPAILLDKQATDRKRVPLALLGKVCCRVDVSNGAIAAGDLLTTSSTPGRAMRLSDPVRGFGASLGKALRPHSEGSGLIPILIALQ